MSIIEFQRRFRTEVACRKHLFKLKWPDGFRCPICGHHEYFNLPKRQLFQCKSCGHQTSVTADTIMHRTRTPLRKWFWAIYLVANDKRGLSALQLSKKLKVSYFVAWSMLQRIRRAMKERDSSYELKGVIEIDEAFFAVLSANIEHAETDGDKEAAKKLKGLETLAFELLEELTPRPIKFINQLMEAQYPRETKKLLEDNAELVDNELLRVMDLIIENLTQSGEKRTARQLREIRDQARAMLT